MYHDIAGTVMGNIVDLMNVTVYFMLFKNGTNLSGTP